MECLDHNGSSVDDAGKISPLASPIITTKPPAEDNRMAVSPQDMQAWCGTLLAGRAANPDLTLADYLDAIPGLGSLDDLPSGTPVLVRGDVDAKPGAKIGEGDIRLRSMVDTLQFGQQRGWKQIIFGHIGRKPEGSLAKVATRLGEILGMRRAADHRLARRKHD